MSKWHTPDFDHNNVENATVRASPRKMRGLSDTLYLVMASFPQLMSILQKL